MVCRSERKYQKGLTQSKPLTRPLSQLKALSTSQVCNPTNSRFLSKRQFQKHTCPYSNIRYVLSHEVEDLLLKGAIKPTKEDGGWCPVINLQRLNRYISTPHFKMESIASLKDVIQKGDFMGKLDTYLSVPIAKRHQKFTWESQPYQFESLPFGLASAPRTSYSFQWDQK